MLQISSQSVQSVRVPVTVTKQGAAYDPTGDAVQLAFVTPLATPASWVNAQWDTDPTTTPPTHYAIAQVGPGTGNVLAVGLWDVFVRITDNPEIPALRAGPIEIF